MLFLSDLRSADYFSPEFLWLCIKVDHVCCNIYLYGIDVPSLSNNSGLLRTFRMHFLNSLLQIHENSSVLSWVLNFYNDLPPTLPFFLFFSLSLFLSLFFVLFCPLYLGFSSFTVSVLQHYCSESITCTWIPSIELLVYSHHNHHTLCFSSEIPHCSFPGSSVYQLMIEYAFLEAHCDKFINSDG